MTILWCRTPFYFTITSWTYFNFFFSGVPEGDLEGSMQLQFEESSQEYVGTET